MDLIKQKPFNLSLQRYNSIFVPANPLWLLLKRKYSQPWIFFVFEPGEQERIAEQRAPLGPQWPESGRELLIGLFLQGLCQWIIEDSSDRSSWTAMVGVRSAHFHFNRSTKLIRSNKKLIPYSILSHSIWIQHWNKGLCLLSHFTHH